MLSLIRYFAYAITMSAISPLLRRLRFDFRFHAFFIFFDTLFRRGHACRFHIAAIDY
jgi:hypothetical protein